jgi:hypothetical protein
MVNISVPEGSAFVPGRSGETATKLLDLAEELTGSRKEVRAVHDGYIVPAEVADAFMGVDEKKSAPRKRASKSTAKNAEATPDKDEE